MGGPGGGATILGRALLRFLLAPLFLLVLAGLLLCFFLSLRLLLRFFLLLFLLLSLLPSFIILLLVLPTCVLLARADGRIKVCLEFAVLLVLGLDRGGTIVEIIITIISDLTRVI